MIRHAEAMLSSLLVAVIVCFVASVVGHTADEPVKSYDDIEDKWVGDAGDAVDLFTGDLFIGATDVALPARGGLPLTFSRSYVSGVYKATRSNVYDCRIDTSGGDTTIHNRLLGVGWQMPMTKILGDTLYVGGAPETMFHDNSDWGKANGRLKTKSFAIYTNHYNNSDPSDTLWTDTLLFLDGTRWLFSRKRTEGNDKSFHGKYLRRIVDPVGNYVEFVYFQSRPLLKEIKESTGRRMWFTYNVMADTAAPTDSTVLTSVSYRNHAGDTVSVQYHYAKIWGVNYLSAVVSPSGDSVIYQYSNDPVDEAWNDCIGYCSLFDTLLPGVYLLSEMSLPGGRTVEYQYAQGLVQSCAEADSATIRMFVYRRIQNDIDTTEFRSQSCLSSSSWTPQEIYVWNNYTGDSAVYRYFSYWCEGIQHSCSDDSTNAGINWIKKFDLRGQTCGSRTTPISEKHFKWCDTKVGYTSLTDPGTPKTIPHLKKVISIQCGDTVSITETTKDTCTGAILKTYTRLSQGSDAEWALDSVKSKYFSDQLWKTFVIERESIENTLNGRDTTREYVYWDTTNVRPRARRIGIGADTIRVEEYQYDSYGNVTKVVSVIGDTVESIFDASGTFVVSARNNQNGKSWLTSNFSAYTGVLQKVTDTVVAESTLYFYDVADRLIRVGRPLDLSDTSVMKRYYSAARISRDSIRFRPDVFLTTETELDVFGRVVQAKQFGDSSIITRTFYDPPNRTVKSVRARYSSDVDSAVTQVISDAFGRHRKTIYPTGDIDSTSYGYRTVTRYNANREVVKKTLVDGFGRTVKVWADQSLSDSVLYRHGPFGRLHSVRNPMGDSSYSVFDVFNRVSETREVDHDSSQYAYYDRAGSLRFGKNPMGIWVYYKYDKLGRITEFGRSSVALIADSVNVPTYPTANTTPLTKYTYDHYAGESDSDSANYVKPHGYLTKRWDRQGNAGEAYTFFYYDKRGRVAQESVKLDGLSIKKVKYFFNLADGLDSLEYPNGQRIKYTYDSFGRILNIPNFVDSTLAGSSSGFVYEPWGALREIRFADPDEAWLHTRFAYDKLSRDTLEYTVNHATLGGDVVWWGARYSYNNLGQLATVHNINTSGAPTTKVGEYKYTYLGQIDTAFTRSVIDTNQSKTQRWWYDDNGKWTSTLLNGTTTTFTYAGGRGRLLRKTTGGVGAGYAYDAWGNVTNDSSKGDSYSYDNATNVLQLILPNGTFPHHDSLTFYYDALGRKVKEKYTYWDRIYIPTSVDSGGMEESMIEGPQGETESDPGEPPCELCWYTVTTVTYYIWQGDKVIAEYDKDGNLKNNFVYANGKQIARFTDQATANIGYVVSDHLGSLRVFSQKGLQVGSKWQAVDYQPFGEILKETVSGSVRDNYLYTGKERENTSAVNLTYFGARWYDGTIGRFLQTDRAGEGTNAYSLALNNPLTGVDPWGLQTLSYHSMVVAAGGWLNYLQSMFVDRRESTLQHSWGWYQDQAKNNPSALGYRELAPEPDATAVSVKAITGGNRFTYKYDLFTGQYGYQTPWGFVPEREGDIILTNTAHLGWEINITYAALVAISDVRMLGDPNYNFDPNTLGVHAVIATGNGHGITAVGTGMSGDLIDRVSLSEHLPAREIKSVWRTPAREINRQALEYANAVVNEKFNLTGHPGGENCNTCVTQGNVNFPSGFENHFRYNLYEMMAPGNPNFRVIDRYTEPELPSWYR